MMIQEIPEWVFILGNFGFPIAITIYLFYRFEKKIVQLESVIVNLSDVIKDWVQRRNN